MIPLGSWQAYPFFTEAAKEIKRRDLVKELY